jgi:hypothetical protein
MLNGDKDRAVFLLDCRGADAADGRCSNCEMRYKPVGLRGYERGKPTAAACRCRITTIVRRTG